MKTASKLKRSESGIALVITLLLLVLMSSLMVGFFFLINSGQKVSGANSDYSRAFYAAQAGMEKLTADLGTLFDNTYAPSAAELAVVRAAVPNLANIKYQKDDGTSGYLLDYPTDANGNPLASNTQVKNGPFQGLTALTTPYTLTINARTSSGSEVKLQRTTQTVAISVFQFGVFSDVDLGFHAGANFSFGGRVHTNGNLFLAEGQGATLTISDRVTAYKDVIRTNLMNGLPLAQGNWTGTVNITTSPGTANFRALNTNEGSLTGNVGSSPTGNWTSISIGASNYAGNLRNGAKGLPRGTGAKQLKLAVVTLGNGLTQSIDILRRPVQAESASVTGERYFAQASLKILLSDDPQDIMKLPCIDGTVQPFLLDDLALPVAAWASPNATALKAAMTGVGTTPLPLAASGAGAAYSPSFTVGPIVAGADGYWYPNGRPLIQGYIKIEAQTAYGSPCGTWKDVTKEVLSLGYAGRNQNPVVQSTDGNNVTPQWLWNGPLAGAYQWLPALPGAAINPSACADPHPNAIIRLEHIRDNPSSAPYSPKPSPVGGWNPPKSSVAQQCGVDPATGAVDPNLQANATDFWPNALFDTREGLLRDASPAGNLGAIQFQAMPSLAGVMNYIELDAKNLSRWFTGAIGTNGPNTRDPQIAPNNFVVYISDRRGNYTPNQAWAGNWPPLSPSGHETGEYGFSDFVNSTDAANGCPNNGLDAGEDLAGTSQLYTYGGNVAHAMSAYGGANYGQMGPFAVGVLKGNSVNFALTANPACPTVATVWPYTLVVHAAEARQNPNFFFRHAVKIVNGSLLNLGNCPGTVPCGLSLASENPVYIRGDYNANSANNGFGDPSVATSIIADAATMLSNQWTDVNSFSSPYAHPGRPAGNTFYRTAIVAGKGLGFPWIAGSTTDTGSDGGVHNFLRYIESWNGRTLSYRGSIASLFYDRQAVGYFKCCATVYFAPVRAYAFDTNFLTPAQLPPRTPMFRDVNTTGYTQLLLPKQ
jgi:Tfp pilus assembly protein PilX